MKNWYKNLQPRFLALHSHVQILNIVSDLKKAQNQSGINADSMLNHQYRALILLDYIIADAKWRGKRGELLRLREVLGSLIMGEPMATLDQLINTTLLMDAQAYRIMKNV